MSPIMPRVSRISKSYRQHKVTRLFVQQQSSRQLTNCGDFLQTRTLNDLIANIKSATHTLLLAMESIVNDVLIETIREVSQKGVRVYLLCGSEQSNHRAIDILKQRCHVRTGVSQQGSILLIDHATSEAKGWMYSLCSPWLKETTSLQCQFTTDQIDVAFRSFAKLFWEYTTDEGIDDQLGKAKKSPTGSIQLNGSFHLPKKMKEHLSKALESLQKACIKTDSMVEIIGPRCAKQSKLLIHSEVSSQSVSNYLKNDGAIHLMDREIPNLLIGEVDEAWLLPDEPQEDSVNWCVRLSHKQREQIQQAFHEVYQEPQWYWYDEILIEKIGLQTPIRFAVDLTTTRCCSEQIHEELPPYSMKTMEDFWQADSEIISKDHTHFTLRRLAFEVLYTVTIEPPYLPDTIKPDPLYKQWDKVCDQWQANIDLTYSRLEKLDIHSEGVSEWLLKSLSKMFLGNEKKGDDCRQKLGQLEQWNPKTSSKGEREEYVQQLRATFEDVQQLHSRTHRKKEELKQEKKWKQQQQILNEEESEALSNMQIQEKNLATETERIAEERKQIDVDFQQVWRDKLNGLDEKEIATLSIKAETVLSFTLTEAIEWKQKIEKNKQEKKKKRLLLTIVKEYLHKDQAQQRILKTSQNKVKDAQKRHLDAQEKRQKHGDRFTYIPNTDRSFEEIMGVKETVLFTLEWPTEEYPDDCIKLWKNKKKQRYVSIQNVEHRTIGEKEAARFQATLCVEKGE